MSQINAVHNTICFIENHLMNTIRVADMAEKASYSLYHFCRVFGKTTYHSPHDYLIRRRMTEAADEIIHTNRKIIDIALDYQFESHEGFTRAFGRVFTISPSEARHQRHVSVFRTLPRLSFEHLNCLKQHNYLPVTILEHKCTDFPENSVHVHISKIGIAPDIDRCFIDLTPKQLFIEKKASWHKVARFDLLGAMDNLKWTLDWILHSWLFFAPYELLEPLIFIRKFDESTSFLFVPII